MEGNEMKGVEGGSRKRKVMGQKLGKSKRRKVRKEKQIKSISEIDALEADILAQLPETGVRHLSIANHHDVLVMWKHLKKSSCGGFYLYLQRSFCDQHTYTI